MLTFEQDAFWPLASDYESYQDFLRATAEADAEYRRQLDDCERFGEEA